MLLEMLLLACSADPATPAFEVVNKCPPAFVVVNRVPAAPALPTDSSQPAPAGYQWVKRGDSPWKLESAPEVAVPKGATFPAGRHEGHACPKCGFQSAAGTGTWIVRGFNADGSHRHQCPVDGTVWSH